MGRAEGGRGAAGRGVTAGAAFLMATSAIGPGFLTQTAVFTGQLRADLAFAILASVALALAVQLNTLRCNRIFMLKHDVLVIGAGLAGLRAAVGTSARYDTAVLSKVHPVRSHSIAAQGGMNASLANVEGSKDDNPEKHTFDTVKGSDYLADQPAARVMCEQAPLLVYELDHWGCPWKQARKW